MPHRDAVSHGDRVEPPRHAAAFFDAFAGNIRLVVERGVAGGGIIARRRDPDERPRNFLLGQTHCVIV